VEDITIAVIRGLDWVSLRPYAVSLARTGFKGTKLMLLEDTSEQARTHLAELGFTLVDRAPTPKEFGVWEYGVHRFPPAIEYLKQNAGRFRYVLWTDIRDVVFQSDPFVWLENNLAPNKIVVAGLGHAIKDCAYNDPWVRAASPSEYAHVRQLEAVACGTFGGEADAMLRLLEEIYTGCITANNAWATDQGMLNVLIRRPEFNAQVSHTGETLTAQWWPARGDDPIIYPHYFRPVFDKTDGLVKGPNGVPYSIVHLYDRDSAWVAVMREKYK
jgi:hypothetical protein